MLQYRYHRHRARFQKTPRLSPVVPFQLPRASINKFQMIDTKTKTRSLLKLRSSAFPIFVRKKKQNTCVCPFVKFTHKHVKTQIYLNRPFDQSYRQPAKPNIAGTLITYPAKIIFPRKEGEPNTNLPIS